MHGLYLDLLLQEGSCHEVEMHSQTEIDVKLLVEEEEDAVDRENRHPLMELYYKTYADIALPSIILFCSVALFIYMMCTTQWSIR